MKTVFVIGAGASCEADLPSGAELKTYIADALNILYRDGTTQSAGSRVIAEAFMKMHYSGVAEANALQNAGWRIRDAMPQAISIDNFVDVHGSEPLVQIAAKMAIVTQILEAEARSKLQHVRDHDSISRVDMDLKRLENTWYAQFFQLLTENCRLENLKERLSTISLVIFNYDRCVERYLQAALMNYYNLSGEAAREFVDSISIFHPYGQVGVLPKAGHVGTQFGGKIGPDQLIALIKEVKTFTESTDPNDARILSLRHHVSSADRLVFLGFAFHRLNVELLLPQGQAINTNFSRRIFGTAAGMSSDDCDVVKDDLHDRLKTVQKSVLRTDLKCASLFQEFRRSLSLL